jgi:hypothetical protein
MQTVEFDEFVELFREGGSIEKLAAQKPARPVRLKDPLDVPEVRKLAQDGNVVADIICGLSEQYRELDRDTFKEAIEQAGVIAGELLKIADNAAPVVSRVRDPNRYSKLLDQAGVVSQLWPGTIGGIPNMPGPLASMAVLGTLGAAGGSLLGRAVGENDIFDKRQMRRMTTMGGLLTGLLPGLAYMGLNYNAGLHPVHGRVLSLPPRQKIGRETDPRFFGRPDLIPVERMQELIWEDPQVAGRLPVSVAAATSALVEGASRQQTRTPIGYVTPSDIARMAMGMGAGYSSGLLVGKALGGLFGISPVAQQVLRNTGAAAGLIRTFVPFAYGA